MFIFGLTEVDLKPVIDLCMIFYTGFCYGPKEVMTSLGFATWLRCHSRLDGFSKSVSPAIRTQAVVLSY